MFKLQCLSLTHWATGASQQDVSYCLDACKSTHPYLLLLDETCLGLDTKLVRAESAAALCSSGKALSLLDQLHSESACSQAESACGHCLFSASCQTQSNGTTGTVVSVTESWQSAASIASYCCCLHLRTAQKMIVHLDSKSLPRHMHRICWLCKSPAVDNR